MTRLKELDVSGTGITDIGLAQLEALDEIERIEAKRTQLTDTCFLVFEKLPKLNLIWISGTKVTEKGVSEFRKAHPAIRVVVDDIDQGGH